MHTKVFLLALLTVVATGPVPAVEVGAPAPDISAATWLNSSPRQLVQLRGRVVLVEFWTYGCSNCRNVMPYVRHWYDRYHEHGLDVIAVHTPEFDYEHNLDNVRRFLEQNAIHYPVAMDNDFTVWNRYENMYWPAMYLIDKRGVVRDIKIGEGEYDRTEEFIRKLLAEGG